MTVSAAPAPLMGGDLELRQINVSIWSTLQVISTTYWIHYHCCRSKFKVASHLLAVATICIVTDRLRGLRPSPDYYDYLIHLGHISRAIAFKLNDAFYALLITHTLVCIVRPIPPISTSWGWTTTRWHWFHLHLTIADSLIPVKLSERRLPFSSVTVLYPY